MSNRRKAQNPTGDVADEILAEVLALPESSLDEVAMELSDVTHHLQFIDADDLLRTEGVDACRYGLQQLHEAVADLLSTCAATADALGKAVPATTRSTTS